MPKPKFCWDTTVLIAHLTAEPRAQDEVDGLREVVNLVDSGQAILVTSLQAIAEVLPDDSSPDLQGRLKALFRRPNCIMVDLSAAVVAKAADMRQRARETGRRLKSPDAYFLATGVLLKVDAVHTFDDQLLGLSGSPIVDGITICKPRGEQTLLAI
jgi:predicted nucleic acid-binding protein